MQQTELNPIDILKQQIAASRRMLHDLWNAHGASDPTVVAASVELDRLINQYHRLKWERADRPDYQEVSE
ncbi:Spo0E like sporulation regulatory protein [Hydrogenispora ethanolica]|jgi:hypothetical protein|uniref:Spo0E like sporulation regulatory protein n=1 Tax=Hydrogenispora ethanolica TaxID=1082276 RepID=A0A4R1R0L3_HYDET|nr:aspartyl-phosphate phosphatase Spo0E family protein [Hydrogenispora ethanolica]TCL58821.1 Spo0E like sporulation regulatory protein [Hydrogenispora ethanolica]